MSSSELLALSSVVVRSSRTATSPFFSTVWCSWSYKPYLFWKRIVWWSQWPRRGLRKRQIQRQRHTDTNKDKCVSKTQCMLYIWKAWGSRISNMAFPPNFSTENFQPKIFNQKFSTKNIPQQFIPNIFHQKIHNNLLPNKANLRAASLNFGLHFSMSPFPNSASSSNRSLVNSTPVSRVLHTFWVQVSLKKRGEALLQFRMLSESAQVPSPVYCWVIYRYKIGRQLALKTIKDFCFRETCND